MSSLLLCSFDLFNLITVLLFIIIIGDLFISLLFYCSYLYTSSIYMRTIIDLMDEGHWIKRVKTFRVRLIVLNEICTYFN